MENRKGSGIFLGIVSIATLIVAIIGATFAYFSATTESADDAVNLTAYEYKLDINVTRIYPASSVADNKLQLIPMDPTTAVTISTGNNNTNLLYALNEAKERCIDDHGLQVCALYQVTITNEAQNAVSFSGVLQTMTNNAATDADGASIPDRTPFANLMYQSVSGSHSDNTLARTVVGESPVEPVALKTETGQSIAIDDIYVTGATTSEGGAVTLGTGTSYVLVYLNEAGDQKGEMGASFTGKLIYTSKSDDANKLTAMFKVA